MSKICKYSNLYTKDGILIRKAPIKDITLKEVSDLVDKLGAEKDENGNILHPEEFNNAARVLMNMYNDPKYKKEREELIKEFANRIKVQKEEVEKSLKETKEELKNK